MLTGRWALAAGGAMLMAACGRSDNEPTPIMVLTEGVYNFSISLEGASCVQTGQAPMHDVALRTVPDDFGADWVFRVPDQPESTFELWVHATSGPPLQIHGKISGKASISAEPSVSVDFGTLGIIAGIADRTTGSGAITGQVRFVDTQGNALTCTKTRWAFGRIQTP
jgi:hypothetical protein